MSRGIFSTYAAVCVIFFACPARAVVEAPEKRREDAPPDLSQQLLAAGYKDTDGPRRERSDERTRVAAATPDGGLKNEPSRFNAQEELQSREQRRQDVRDFVDGELSTWNTGSLYRQHQRFKQQFENSNMPV